VRVTVAVLTALLLIAVAGGITAYQQSNIARAETLVAQSRQLVAEASSIRDSQPDLARQLMVPAYRLAPTAEAVGALVESYAMPGSSTGAAACTPPRTAAGDCSPSPTTVSGCSSPPAERGPSPSWTRRTPANTR
jgi:hypothetical protein